MNCYFYRMFRHWLILLLLFCAGWTWPGSRLTAQYTETDIKIYNFTDGLSHRNVFAIEQDAGGLIWLATINGLNSFDGYGFQHFDQQEAYAGLEMINELELDEDSLLYATSPDYFISHNLQTGRARRFQIKAGEIRRRESVVPTAATSGANGGVFMVLQEERSGRLSLNHYRPGKDKLPVRIAELDGQYNQRPLVHRGDTIYCGAYQSELWLLDALTGSRIASHQLPPTPAGETSRISDLHARPDALWILLEDGRVFSHHYGSTDFTLFPAATPATGNSPLQSLHVAENGDIYVGGFGSLFVYDHWKREWEDLDAPIRQLVKNTCTYRDILVDISGTAWVASDFGAIRITRNDRLFTQYLSGGSEYCSNVYCSTRGITEDENGIVYISYYNSIHRLDPVTNDLRPLFPSNDYFNYPYGLHYYNDHLYTGDGARINLKDLRVEQLFADDGESEGAITQSATDSIIWYGYDQQLLFHDPRTDSTSIYRDDRGRSWNQLTNGSTITYLLHRPGKLFVGTKDAGLYELSLAKGQLRQWQKDSTQFGLASNRINAIHFRAGGGYQSSNVTKKTRRNDSGDERNSQSNNRIQPASSPTEGQLFLATAKGIHRVDLPSGLVTAYISENGAELPNDFINGILPEGDSVIWVSTDHGLCRFSLENVKCANFFTTDGLSSDEFNRISFFRSRNGRMYFGGLNGINAFRPEPRFLEERRERSQVPLMITDFTYVDGRLDSIFAMDPTEINERGRIELSHRDRQFNFSFSLADYRSPNQNRYSYFLEGYDQGWSGESTDYNLRFTDLPPGDYILHVKARVAQEDWMDRQLSIPLIIEQPYYYNWWFWVSVIGVIVLVGFGLLRYRIHLTEQQRLALEKTVKERTAELAAEKQKSEELLLNILPAQTARELMANGHANAYRHERVTVFFSDFVSFTAIASKLEPEVLVRELDLCFRTFDEIVANYGLEKIKTIGDAYLFIGGHDTDETGLAAINCVRAARDIQAFLKSHHASAKAQQRPAFKARIGMHTGPIVAGVVGTHKFAYDIWGETVNIAARMESNGVAEGIVVSESTYKLIRSEFACRPYKTFEEHERQVEMWEVLG
ncbi:hypothetical protein CEQ90_08075 [Lewinellaceae bacterium SD302]|nr:hypothetical protein CEQ90_08075 [Lewinellaceae bacterium SD302]